MLQIPKRAAALGRWYEGEVVGGWRRGSGPLQSPGIPRIAAAIFATVVRPQQVSQENYDSGGLKENPYRHNEVPSIPTAAGFVRVDSSRHAQESRDMHEVERQVEANKEKPEMQLADPLAIHLSRHLGKPVVKGSEEREENGTHDHVVKMRNHKVGIPQLPVKRGCAQHDSREAGDQKLEEKGDAEQHWSLELQLSSPHGCQPVEDLDAGRNGNRHGRNHEKSVRGSAHAYREHVVGPHTHADEPDRDSCPYHHRIPEDRFAGEHRNDF